DPLAIQHVALPTTWHVAQVRRVDQKDLEPSLLQELEDRDPVDPRRLHRDGRDAAARQPVHEPMQITGEAAELAHRRRVAIGRYGHPVAAAANVDAGRVGPDDGHLLCWRLTYPSLLAWRSSILLLFRYGLDHLRAPGYALETPPGIGGREVRAFS